MLLGIAFNVVKLLVLNTALWVCSKRHYLCPCKNTGIWLFSAVEYLGKQLKCLHEPWMLVSQMNCYLSSKWDFTFLRNAQQLTSRLLQCSADSCMFSILMISLIAWALQCLAHSGVIIRIFLFPLILLNVSFKYFKRAKTTRSPTRLKGKIRALAEVLLKYFIEPEYYYFICVWDCSSRLADDRTQNGVPWILAALMLTLTDSLDFDNKHVGVNSYSRY